METNRVWCVDALRLLVHTALLMAQTCPIRLASSMATLTMTRTRHMSGCRLEWKLLKQFQTLFMHGLGLAHDVCEVVAINTRCVATEALLVRCFTLRVFRSAHQYLADVSCHRSGATTP